MSSIYNCVDAGLVWFKLGTQHLQRGSLTKFQTVAQNRKQIELNGHPGGLVITETVLMEDSRMVDGRLDPHAVAQVLCETAAV